MDKIIFLGEEKEQAKETVRKICILCNYLSILFLFRSGIITSILMFDDLFLLHEEVIPEYLHIKESWVFLLYLIIVSLYLIKLRKLISKTYLTPLQMAVIFFALSIACDKSPIEIPNVQIEVLLEDSLKLIGIVSWFVYFTLVSNEQLERATNASIDTTKE